MLRAGARGGAIWRLSLWVTQRVRWGARCPFDTRSIPTSARHMEAFRRRTIMKWIDRMLLVGVAVAVLGGAALYTGTQRAGAVDRPDAGPLAGAAPLDQRIARIIEHCVIEGAGTHLAFIQCEFRK